MPKKRVLIRVKNNNRKVIILAPVKDSLHSSILSDRIDKLPYLKVYERTFYPKCNYAHVQCHTILGEFNYQKLFDDLELMSDLILLENETAK